MRFRIRQILMITISTLAAFENRVGGLDKKSKGTFWGDGMLYIVK